MSSAVGSPVRFAKRSTVAEFSCPELKDPTVEDAFGKCHLCRSLTMISCCVLCEHWFCGDCRVKWFPRGLEAIKQMVAGRTPGCCGPEEQEKEESNE
jgi:hypothetical protein